MKRGRKKNDGMEHPDVKLILSFTCAYDFLFTHNVSE